MKFFIKYFVISFLIFTLLFTPAIALYDKYIGSKSTAGSGEEDPETGELSSLPLLVDESNPFFEAFNDENRVNVLMFGIADNLTDTIMVASFDTKNKFVDLISVPRDTYYERPKYKKGANQKINAIYASEGLLPFATAVSKTLGGMPLNYYIAFEYKGVARIVDSMGGVPMDIKKRMYYVDKTPGHELLIDIPKGYQTLDGEHAVQFLRYRSGYAEGDLGRIKAQQEFMKSAMKQALGLKLPVVATTVIKNVKTDMSAGDAVKFAGKALGTKSDDIETHQMPGNGKMIGGLSFIVPDEEKIAEMIETIYFEPGATVTPSAVKGADE